jgi:hypothetical protein
MRNFLMGALEYLGSFAEGNLEVPVAIIRAMNDVGNASRRSRRAPYRWRNRMCCGTVCCRWQGWRGRMDNLWQRHSRAL